MALVFFLGKLLVVLCLSLSSLLEIDVLDGNEKLGQQLVLLARVVLADNHVGETCEGEEVHVHHALVLHCINERLVQVNLLRVLGFFLDDEAGEVIWHHIDCILGQIAQEIVQSLFVLLAPVKIVTELSVDLAAVLDHVAVSLEGLHVVFHDLVDLF